MLDKAATREAFIVAAIASGAFREGTFAKLKYRHVKEDLEARSYTYPYSCRSRNNQRQIPRLRYFHKRRSMPAPKTLHRRQTTRRKINAARRTNRRITTYQKQPSHRQSIRRQRKTIRKIVHDLAVGAKIAKKLPNSWMYSVRTHSLRKFFRSQLSTAKIDPEHRRIHDGTHNRHLRRRPKLRHRNPKKSLRISRACNQTQNTSKPH